MAIIASSSQITRLPDTEVSATGHRLSRGNRRQNAEATPSTSVGMRRRLCWETRLNDSELRSPLFDESQEVPTRPKRPQEKCGENVELTKPMIVRVIAASFGILCTYPFLAKEVCRPFGWRCSFHRQQGETRPFVSPVCPRWHELAYGI